MLTRNILDCDQPNYSSGIILSHIPANIVSISGKWLGVPSLLGANISEISLIQVEL